MLETIPPALLTATATTATCVLASRVITATVSAIRAPLRRRQHAEARAREAGWLAERAQQWVRSPAALGGPESPDTGFAGLTFDMLGVSADARDVRHTAVGVYRLIPVAPCATLAGCARLIGAEEPATGGLLVVGTGETPDVAVAVLVLGPLVQVTLPTVPWGWIRALTTPTADPLLPAETEPVIEPVAETAAESRPMHVCPQRERWMPSWRSRMPTTRRRDRAAVQTA